MIKVSSNLQKGEVIQLKKEKEISFEGRRTDHNLVSVLKDKDGQALIRTRARELKAAIERLSKDSGANNISFLLDVAENLQYGFKKGSELEKFIKTESNIAKEEQVQNVDWAGILKGAIESALKKNRSDNRQELVAMFETLYPPKQEKASGLAWLSVNPSANLEKQLIQYRNAILESATFKKGLAPEVEQQIKTYSRHFKKYPEHNVQDQIKQHLDYFIASSEAALPEKVEIVKQLAHLVSDEYKINPQLEGRKLQLLSEMINDIVVKVPSETMLTIKDMIQKHGTCAAISTSRKSLAHEHKLAYVNNILAEMNDQPTMMVWDPTDPKNEAKIETQKADIDWSAAFKENYRLVDAGVTNWMHIADNMGTGLRKAGQFIPFDVENYGMFRDSHLMVDMDPDVQPKYDLLRACIKLNGAIKKLHVDKVERQKASETLKSSEFENSSFHAISKRKVESALADAAQQCKVQMSAQELNGLANKLISAEPLKNEKRQLEDKAIALEKEGQTDEAQAVRTQMKELAKGIIDPSEGKVTKKVKLAHLIKTAMPEISDAVLDQTVEKVAPQFLFIEDIEGKESELKGKFKLKGQNSYKKELFTVAAYQRVKKEFEVKVPERLEAMAKELNVEAKPEIVLAKLEAKGEILPRTTLDKMYDEFNKLDRHLEQDIKKGEPGWKSDSKLFKAFDQFKADFKQVEKTFPSIRREVKRDYKDLNKELEVQLDEVYDINGRGEGAFWVGEEGGSGLNTGQYSRILKQLSGVDRFTEQDVEKILDHIESGKSGAVTGTMVEHYEFSGHAQYVYDVRNEKVQNPVSGEVEDQRVLYHDNTWGHKELRHTYKDDGAHDRTDYGSKRGGPLGYLLGPELINGTTERDLLSAVGMHKPDKLDQPWAKKLDKSIGVEYPMFMDCILEGKYLSAHSKASTIVNAMLKSRGPQVEKQVDRFMGRLMLGNQENIHALVSDIGLEVFKAASEVIDKGNSVGFKDAVEAAVTVEIESAKQSIFKPGGQKDIKANVPAKIAEVLDQIMKTDMSASMKKVEAHRAIADVLSQEIFENTHPGERVNIKMGKSFEKQTDKLEKQLIKFIRGADRDIPGTEIKDVRSGGIQSREEFDALPEDNLLKMLLSKMVMIDHAVDNQTYLAVDRAKTPADLKKAHNLLVSMQKAKLRSFFGKDPAAIEATREAFLEAAAEGLEELTKETNVPMKPLADDLRNLTANVKDANKGSVSQLKEQLQSGINKVVDRFVEGSGGQLPEVETKLKVRLQTILDETIDENFGMQSVQELEQSWIGRAIVNWIDAKFDPKTDEQFMTVFNKLSNMKTETFDKLLDKATPEEIGLQMRDRYAIVQRIRGMNDKAEKNFKTAIRNHVHNELVAEKTSKAVEAIIVEHKEWCKTEEAAKLSPQEKTEILEEKIENYYKNKADLASLYRNLEVEFSYIDMEKFLKKQKQEALDKYSARPSFPNIKVVSNENIKKTAEANLAKLEGLTQQANALKAAETQYADNAEALEQISAQQQVIKDNIKLNTYVLTRSQIRPRHQDDMFAAINAWVKETGKNPGSDKAKEMKAAIVEQFQKDSVFHYPDELLEQIAKTVPEMVFNGGKVKVEDQQVFNAWNQAMKLCLSAVQRSFIEFKIKENIRKGRMPQVAKALRNNDEPLLQNPKTGKGFAFDSKEGLGIIFQVLQDPANSNSTLKFFVEQAGLTETAINHFLEGPKPEKSVEYINMNIDKLRQHQADQEVIQDTFEQFVAGVYEQLGEKGIKAVPVEGLPVFVEQYFNVLDIAFANNKDSHTLSSYKSTIKEALQVTAQLKLPAPEGDAMNFLLEWQEQIMQKQDDYVEAQIEQCITHMNILNGRYQGLTMLEDLVPEFHSLKPTINEYKIRLNTAKDDIDKIRETLQAPILAKVEKAAKAQQAQQAEAVKKMQNMTQDDMMKMLKEQGQVMLNTLIAKINQNDQASCQAIIKQVIETDNPILDEMILEVFKTNDHPILKTYAAGILGQKGVIDPLAEYLDTKVIDADGNFNRELDFEKDQCALLAFDYVAAVGTNTPDDQYNMEKAAVIANVLNAACDHKDATPLMDAILNRSLQVLVNQGEAIQDMLIEDIIENPEAHINTRSVAIDIIGRYESIAFMPVFEDVLFNAANYSEQSYEQLSLMDVALKSVHTYAQNYPEAYDYKAMLNKIKAIDLKGTASAAKAQNSEAKEVDSKVDSIQKRIEILEQFLKNPQGPQTQIQKAA